MDNYGCLQGARLLGMGTLIFSRNYAKGTFIREGTFIRQCIVPCRSVAAVCGKLNPLINFSFVYKQKTLH